MRATTCGVGAALGVMAAAFVASTAGAVAPDRPSAEVAATAWVAAREWVNAGRVPEPTSENAQVSLEGVFAAGAVLRLRGHVVGVGEDAVPDAGLLRRAVGRALADLAANVVADLPESLRAELASELTLELALCGEPAPLAGATYATAAAFIDPGRDAIALRRGDSWHLATAGRLLASNLAAAPEQTLRRLAREAELPAGEVRELAAIESIGLYRLPTMRLVQASPDGPPVEAIRSRAVVPLASIDAETIGSMVDSMLARIASWMVSPSPEIASSAGDDARPQDAAMPASLGLRGDYDPIADRHRPLVASPFEQAMTALALARLTQVSPEHRDQAHALLARLVGSLVAVDPVEEPVESSPEALATLAIVFALRPDLVELDPSTANLASTSRRSVEDLVRSNEAFASASPGRRVLAATAAAQIASLEASSDADGRSLGADRLREAWEACDASSRVGLLPWFAMAQRSLGGGIDPAELQALRAALLLRQLDANAQGDSGSDLGGGFELREGPLPSADNRSNVAALGLAILLGDVEVTPIDGSPASAEGLKAAARSHRAAVRFLRQMTAEDGGVTAAPWDLRQPVLAQAIGLWLLAESIAAGVP
ncbi:MAG: hypothetical protein ACO3NL_00300 [Phycisphaerales bacterium]